MTTNRQGKHQKWDNAQSAYDTKPNIFMWEIQVRARLAQLIQWKPKYFVYISKNDERKNEIAAPFGKKLFYSIDKMHPIWTNWRG